MLVIATFKIPMHSQYLAQVIALTIQQVNSKVDHNKHTLEWNQTKEALRDVIGIPE